MLITEDDAGFRAAAASSNLLRDVKGGRLCSFLSLSLLLSLIEVDPGGNADDKGTCDVTVPLGFGVESDFGPWYFKSKVDVSSPGLLLLAVEEATEGGLPGTDTSMLTWGVREVGVKMHSLEGKEFRRTPAFSSGGGGGRS